MILGASVNLPASTSLADETARINWLIGHLPPMPIRLGYFAWSVFNDPAGAPDFSRIDRISAPFYKAGWQVIWDYSPDPQAKQPGWVAVNGGQAWSDWWDMPERVVPVAKACFAQAIAHEVTKLDALGLPHSRCGWFVGNERTGGAPQAPKSAPQGVFAASTHAWLDEFAAVDLKGTLGRGPALCMFGSSNEATELLTALGGRHTWQNLLPPVVNLRCRVQRAAPFRDASGNPSNWYEWSKLTARYVAAKLISYGLTAPVWLSEAYCTPDDYNSQVDADRADACAALASGFRDSKAVDMALLFTPGFAPLSTDTVRRSDDFALYGSPMLAASAAISAATA